MLLCDTDIFWFQPAPIQPVDSGLGLVFYMIVKKQAPPICLEKWHKSSSFLEKKYIYERAWIILYWVVHSSFVLGCEFHEYKKKIEKYLLFWPFCINVFP